MGLNAVQSSSHSTHCERSEAERRGEREYCHRNCLGCAEGVQPFSCIHQLFNAPSSIHVRITAMVESGSFGTAEGHAFTHNAIARQLIDQITLR